MGKRYEPLDPAGIKTYPLAARPSKVRAEEAPRPGARGTLRRTWTRCRISSRADSPRGGQAVLAARRKGKPVILAMGAHVIKVGLSRILIDLLERGLVTALALNGACAVHDFELATRVHLGGRGGPARRRRVRHGRGDRPRLTRRSPRGWRGAWASAGRWASGSWRSAGASLAYPAGRLRRLNLHARCTSRWGPTSSTCTRGATGRRWGPRRTGLPPAGGVVADLDDGGVYLNVGSPCCFPRCF